MGWAGDLWDAGTDIVEDIGGDIIDTVKDAADDIVNVVDNVVDGVVDGVVDVGKFLVNVVDGVVDTATHIVHGVVTGDWVEFRDGVVSAVTTAVAVAAIVVGVLNGNVALIAAGFVMLDAQYNEGKLLAKVIHYAAEIEQATTKTSYIEEYAVEIQGIITVVAALYAGYTTAPYIWEFTGLSTATAQWATELNVLEAGYGGYQTYMAIQAIKDSQDYWKAQLREAEEYYRKLIAQAQAAKEQWFGMMTDFDLINRIQAGGDMFTMGAGHDMFSMTSVAEPRFALGLIDKSDSEMDKLINNRYFAQSAGSDGFKIN
jgi:hypothetical protein